MISGINGGNCILSSMAQCRVQSGMIDAAQVRGKKDEYYVFFRGKAAEWDGEQLALSSSRNPYEPRTFKSIDGAVSAIVKLGLRKSSIVITE